MEKERKQMLIELSKEFLRKTDVNEIESIEVESGINSLRIDIYWNELAPSLELEQDVENPEFDYVPYSQEKHGLL